jgi:hypothetical protein
MKELDYKKMLPYAAGAAGVVAIAGFGIFVGSKGSSISVSSDFRFEDSSLGVLADSMNGDLFGWIDTPDGRRFVKYDKTSESRARKDTAPKPKEPEVKIVYRDRNADSSKDVRSGRIFERNDKFKKEGTTFTVNSKIKYRDKESKMLYRIAISVLPPIGSNNRPKECITKKQESILQSIYNDKNSRASLRFEDVDKFWLKDMNVPLNGQAANNNKTSIIDANKDSCGFKSELVFHNRANLTLPDFEWISKGKLLYKNIIFKF